MAFLVLALYTPIGRQSSAHIQDPEYVDPAVVRAARQVKFLNDVVRSDFYRHHQEPGDITPKIARMAPAEFAPIPGTLRNSPINHMLGGPVRIEYLVVDGSKVRYRIQFKRIDARHCGDLVRRVPAMNVFGVEISGPERPNVVVHARSFSETAWFTEAAASLCPQQSIVDVGWLFAR